MTSGSPRTADSCVQAFKKFLAYAEHGEILDMPTASGREAASPFQKEVADRLRSHGYEIHDEVKSSGFFVDIEWWTLNTRAGMS